MPESSSSTPLHDRVRELAELERAWRSGKPELAGPHGYDQIPALVERGLQRVADFYSDLETRLSEDSFVAGPQFSAADITAVVTVDFATKALNIGVPEGSDAIRRWYETIAERPSFMT